LASCEVVEGHGFILHARKDVDSERGQVGLYHKGPVDLAAKTIISFLEQAGHEVVEPVFLAILDRNLLPGLITSDDVPEEIQEVLEAHIKKERESLQ
jgi:hypothetical protein